MSSPGPLRSADELNFNTLIIAAQHNHLALVSAIRKSDGKAVAVVCAVNEQNNNEFDFVPLAVMCEGNPFEDFEDPTE